MYIYTALACTLKNLYAFSMLAFFGQIKRITN